MKSIAEDIRRAIDKEGKIEFGRRWYMSSDIEVKNNEASWTFSTGEFEFFEIKIKRISRDQYLGSCYRKEGEDLQEFESVLTAEESKKWFLDYLEIFC